MIEAVGRIPGTFRTVQPVESSGSSFQEHLDRELRQSPEAVNICRACAKVAKLYQNEMCKECLTKSFRNGIVPLIDKYRSM